MRMSPYPSFLESLRLLFHVLLACFLLLPTALPLALPSPKFVILGGTGKIGTAVAAHLVRRSPSCQIVLVGRRSSGADAIHEVRRAVHNNNDDNNNGAKIEFERIKDIWEDGSSLVKIFHGAAAVIHTAGPYSDERTPTVLDAAINAQVPVYVDVSDPLPFLDASLQRMNQAKASHTTALCAAGAFPGMSNVLAMEAAAGRKDNGVKDVRFHYFTNGLGGSGTINLYITNIGFGDAMNQHDDGQRKAFTQLSGKLLGTVDFFIPGLEGKDNAEAQRRVGTQQVFAWPFPEAATVAAELEIKGCSSAAMGTAPDLWNSMLGLLVDIVPRHLWRNSKFSKFMADFSQPLVLATDALLRKTSPDMVGETHAMRIDVTTVDNQMTSIVQAHESFRQCVAQSCAEFALDMLDHPCPGVYLPEQRYKQAADRSRIIEKLTSTSGTFCYTGPIDLPLLGTGEIPVYPSNIEKAMELARKKEQPIH